MTEITQEITPLPASPSRMDPSNFDSKADAFLGAMQGFSQEMATLIPQINSLSSEVEAAALASAANANFAGTWNETDDFAEKSVLYGETIYISLVTPNVANTPSLESSSWRVVPVGIDGGEY